MSKLLLVEDDKSFALNLVTSLRGARLAVDHADCADEARLFLTTYEYSVVVLDWEMPGQSGPELCREIKQQYPHLPVLMLTGRTGPQNTVHGLDAGADDYVQKPCSIDELLARVRALLRRRDPELKTLLECGQLKITEDTHEAEFRGRKLELSPREFELLHFFMKHPDKHFNSESIFMRIWPSRTDVSTELVRVYVKKLRDKLTLAGGSSPIETRAGEGYALLSKLCHENSSADH